LPTCVCALALHDALPICVQALVWGEMTPGMLTSAILPRWWNVTPVELHAIALYQKSGEELLTASEKDEALRADVLAILSNRLLQIGRHTSELQSRFDLVC